jgi:ribose/xylose/arabinose/galactoside ABC-type transport system permease subunit
LATGGLKNTNRFKSADKTLKDAKELYPIATTIVGSSLGGSIRAIGLMIGVLLITLVRWG